MTRYALALAAFAALAANTLSAENAAAPNNHRMTIQIGSHNPQTTYALMEFHLKPGWTTYWKNPGDAGIPLHITKTQTQNINAPKILWPPPERIAYQDGSESYGYKNYVAIPIALQTQNASKNATLRLKGRYAVCAEICIPYEFDETLHLPAKHAAPETDRLIEKALARIPTPIKDPSLRISFGEKTLTMEMAAPSHKSGMIARDIFLKTDSPQSFGKPAITSENGKMTALFPRSLPDNIAPWRAKLDIVILGETRARQLSYNPAAPQTAMNLAAWLLLFLSAFLGGLILNIMPCVLPVVALKLSQASYAARSLSAERQFGMTILGILTSFLLFALLLFLLREAGEAVGWGFHFQEPVFVALMMAILSLFALAQTGALSLSLPAAAQSGMDRIFASLSAEKSLFHFFYGGVIALLATPCTAPFLGSAAAFALTREFPTILALFLAIGTGLSAPYILALALPETLRAKIMPKGGAWTRYVQYGAAALLVGSVLWLLWVLSRQIGTAPALLIFFLMQGALLSLSLRGEALRLFAAAALLTAVAAPALLAPKPDTPQTSREDGLLWRAFNAEEIRRMTRQGKTVFLDLTADWCLTCQYNRRNVLKDSEVIARLGASDIHLMRGDLTNPAPEISAFLKKEGRAGVPFNAVYRGGRRVILSELLTKAALLDSLGKPN